MHAECPSPSESRWSGCRPYLLAALLILAGVANHARSLTWGFLYDDFIHQFALRGFATDGSLRPLDLYAFGTRPEPGDPLYEWGFFPWFTAPDFKIRFFRPVTSMSLWFDYLVYGDWAPGYHVTSLVLFAVFLALTFKLYRDAGAPTPAALWALAFLALDDNHVLPVCWIANRNALLAAAFVVATVLAAHHHRQSGHVGYLLATGACFLLACGAKESGLVALPLVGLYLVLDPRGASRPVPERIGALVRSRCLWLLVVLACGYMAFYVSQGYGTNCVAYCAPWVDPLRHLGGLVKLIPLAGLSLVFGFSADMATVQPPLMPPALAVGIPLLAAVGFVLLRTTGWTRLTGLAVGWLGLALLPEAGVEPMDRLLMTASVGSALLFGLFLHQLGSLRRLIADRRFARLAVAILLLFTGLVIAVPASAFRQRLTRELAGLDRQLIIDADIDRTVPGPRKVFLLNAPSGMISITILATWSVVHDDHDTHISFIQTGRRALDLQREDACTMTLTCYGTPFMTHRFEGLFHAGRVPRAGEVLYETAGFEAVPLVVEPNGIRTVRLRFKKDLDDPSYQFLAWQDGRLKRIAPPAIGQGIHVPEAKPVIPFAP